MAVMGYKMLQMELTKHQEIKDADIVFTCVYFLS